MAHLHVRAEVKPNERRTPITPQNAKRLMDAGYTVAVERSPHRVFLDAEYEAQGCQIVETGSWEGADLSAYIVGLKELPEEDTPLRHTHIYFAHCFKGQTGWRQLLDRFARGNGTLLDLEFLVDDQGRRVAAFGRAAGIAGAACGLMAWCHQRLQGVNEPFPSIRAYPNIEELVAEVSALLREVKEAKGESPKVMVIGAKGRCGKGAMQFVEQVGLTESTAWDMEETAAGGPFPEIARDHHVFVNAIYLSNKIPPFLTDAELDTEDRKLSVVVDVSCDFTNPNNPLPIYSQGTTFASPLVRVRDQEAKGGLLDVVAIDHLPSMIPRESSVDFSNDLFDSLLHVAQRPSLEAQAETLQERVWQRAEKLFRDKLREAAAATEERQ